MDGSRKDPNIMVENRIIFMDRNRKMEKQNAKYVAQKDEEMFFHCTRCDAKFKLMSTLSFHFSAIGSPRVKQYARRIEEVL